MFGECKCRIPDPQFWTVIHITGRDRVVRCSGCNQIWHTTAAYAKELPENLVSPYQWRQYIHSPNYHKGEDTVVGEEGSYLDPDFRSCFETEEIS